MRLFDGEKVKRISPSRVLRNGDVLLLPLDAIGGSSAALASGAFANGGGDSGFGKRASRDRRLRGSSGGGAAGGGEVGEAEDAVGGELAALLALQRRPEPLLEVGACRTAQQKLVSYFVVCAIHSLWVSKLAPHHGLPADQSSIIAC